RNLLPLFAHPKSFPSNSFSPRLDGPPLASSQSAVTKRSNHLNGKEGYTPMKLEITHKTNGVNVTRLQETVRSVQASPELARFKFRLENRWIHCGETQSAVQPFFGCEQTFPHKTNFALSSDEPEILLGNDNAANPVEHLLHALASCVT